MIAEALEFAEKPLKQYESFTTFNEYRIQNDFCFQNYNVSFINDTLTQKYCKITNGGLIFKINNSIIFNLSILYKLISESTND